MNIETAPGSAPPPVKENAAAKDVPVRLPLEPMDAKLTSIQPGGGPIFRLELAWGRLRRRYLKTFRPRYLVRMRMKRRGDFNGCPHEVLDPRDVKFFRNQGGYFWRPQDDPFTWRDRLERGAGRYGGIDCDRRRGDRGGNSALGGCIPGSLADLAGGDVWFAGPRFGRVGGVRHFVLSRSEREVPIGAGLVVVPADGTIVEVTEIADDEFVTGQAVRIGIFLSIFNVHINRMPAPARVIGLHYRRGKMLDARRPKPPRKTSNWPCGSKARRFPIGGWSCGRSPA